MNLVEKYSEVKNSGYLPSVSLKGAGHKGMGVFASKDFEKEEAIEFCHCMIFDWPAKYQRDSTISRYSYSVSCHCNPGPTRPPCLLNCPANGTRYILPLGYGAIYNCADKQEEANASFAIIPDQLLMVFGATKQIKKGEEIVTWWGQGYYDAWCKPKS